MKTFGSLSAVLGDLKEHRYDGHSEMHDGCGIRYVCRDAKNGVLVRSSPSAKVD